MAALMNLQSYGSDDEEETETSPVNEDAAPRDIPLHLQPLSSKPSSSLALVNAAPDVAGKVASVQPIDRAVVKEVMHNPRYEELHAVEAGPANPFTTRQQRAQKNTLAGLVEPAHVNDFVFENQRRTFHNYGYALDPSVGPQSGLLIGDRSSAKEKNERTAFEPGPKKKKRVKEKGGLDAGDIDTWIGSPWKRYEDEEAVAVPGPEDQVELEEYLAKMRRRQGLKRSKWRGGGGEEDEPFEETSDIHIEDAVDYQGRSFLYVPRDVGVNLRADEPPAKCFLPKRIIHTWEGHTKGVSCIRWFPGSGHLLLSASMDRTIKLWEVYNERRLIRTYRGHKQAVRDVSFNNDGTKFLSAGYDKYVRLWDTERGTVISRFTNTKTPYVVKFHPNDDMQHLIVAGTSDKKIVCWDTNSGELVQEYDRHLGAVNTITFIENNRRFVTTSDDKSLRFWEWDIPVDFKYIADPTMHSMPAVTLSPNGKYLICQSLDNKIVTYTAIDRFHLVPKKTFRGHMVSGYACGLDYSPDMSYVISGDADGKLWVWNWKTTRVLTKLKAHDGVCNGCLWHPHETSKVATCGWDGQIHLWD